MKQGNGVILLQSTAGDNYTIGLRADGTVVATGDYVRDITQWKDIVMIYSSDGCVVGLKSDNTFVVADAKTNSIQQGTEEQIMYKLKEKQEEMEVEKQRQAE